MWEEGLAHTVNMDSMLSSVGVSVGVCWRELAVELSFTAFMFGDSFRCGFRAL